MTRIHYTEGGALDGALLCYTADKPTLQRTDNPALVTCRTCRNRLRDSRQAKHEASDVANMVRGGCRGLVRRAGEGDIDALRELVALQHTLQTAITDAGTLLHNYGHSYTLLAAELGVSRQAARQRFTRSTPITMHTFSQGEPT